MMHGDDFSSELERLCYKIPMEMGIYRTVGYTKGVSTCMTCRTFQAFSHWSRTLGLERAIASFFMARTFPART